MLNCSTAAELRRSHLDSYRLAADEAGRLILAKADSVLGENSAADLGGLAFGDAVCNLTQFVDEGVDRIATGEFGVFDVAVRVQQHRLTEIPPCPADDSEIEC